MRLLMLGLAATLLAVSSLAVQAASTTRTGQISVAQVFEIASLAPTDAKARQTLIAYLAGIGETAGLVISEAQNRGARPLHCTNSFNLDENVAVAALSAAAPDRAKWTETAATPIILADMIVRGGCR